MLHQFRIVIPDVEVGKWMDQKEVPLNLAFLLGKTLPSNRHMEFRNISLKDYINEQRGLRNAK